MTEATLWTLDELVQLAGRALSVDYDGPPSARVRDLPDRRLVRWYVTRGLVDRPIGTNGRNALYGRRHLMQLVAIKRLQAAGRSLAEIQGELTGAADRTLERVARLDSGPQTLPAGNAPPAPPAPPAAEAAPATEAARPEPATARAHFWVDRPVAPRQSTAAVPTGAGRASPPPTPTSWPLRAMELAPGVTLLIDPARTADADPVAVRVAARELLDLLVPATMDERSTS